LIKPFRQAGFSAGILAGNYHAGFFLFALFTESEVLFPNFAALICID
jgi:hypothetical protein